jgi:hypothetical protein
MNIVLASEYGSSSIYMSGDGISDWIELTSNTTLTQVMRFGYNPVSERWIAVGLGSSHNIMYSDSPGSSWTGVGGSIFNQFANSVMFNGTVWMVTGQGIGNAIAYSANDGLSWTTFGSSDPYHLNIGRDLAWNPKNGSNGRWVVVGSDITANGVDMIYSDDNGGSWTTITTSVVTFVETIESVVYSNGTAHWVVGARTGGSNTLAWSSNGINWTGATILNYHGNSVSFDTCIDVKWNGSIWVAISTTQIVTSTDGKTWTLRDSVDNYANNILQQLFWTGAYWIITFNAQNSMNNIGIAYSTDPTNSTTWTSATAISGETIPAYMLAIGGEYRVKNYQTLTFNAMTKSVGDAAFTPSVSTDAKPSYSSYSFSVPGSNGVATVNGSQLNIIGPGTVTVTVTQAANEFFEQATANAVLTVSGATSSGILETGYEPAKAFDDDNNTFWHSMDIRGGTILYSQNGSYQGSISTSLTGYSSPQISGEWIQIQLQNAIYLSSFSLTPRAGYEQTRSPEDFVLCASTDGTQFELIKAYTGQTYNASQAAKTFYVSPTTQYSFFRIVVTKCGGGQTGNNGSVQIAEWKLYDSVNPAQEVSFSINSETIENAQINDTISLTGRATSATSAINPIQYSLYNTASSVAIISGTNIVIKGRGLITLRASQSAGNNYSASNIAEQTITVNFPQVVSFSSNSDTVENVQVNDTISLVGRATSATSGTNAIQYSLVNAASSIAIIDGTNIVIKGRGVITLRASQPSGSFYSASNTTDQTITVKFLQTISFTAGATIHKNYGNAPFTPTLTTTASPSYSSYTFSVPGNQNIVTTNGSVLTITGVGTVTVTATQASADNYSSASATVSLIVDRGTQVLTFDKFSRVFGDPPFTPSVSTSANPAYSSLTFSVPAGNGVVQAVNGGTQLEIIGLGRVIVTATQAMNALYYAATASARLTVKIELIKSVYVNLLDQATSTKEFVISQDIGPTHFEAPDQVNFRDYERNFIIHDVLDYFDRVDQLEEDITAFETRTDGIESQLSELNIRADEHTENIQTLYSRLDDIDSDNILLDNRHLSDLARLELDTEQLTQLESQIDQFTNRMSLIESGESGIDQLEQNMNRIESDIHVSQDRADSNALRLEETADVLETIESRINVYQGRITHDEQSILDFSERLSAIESEIIIFENRTESNLTRLNTNDIWFDGIESNIDHVESRTTDSETHITTLDIYVDGYDSTIEEVKGALYAITDGNLESTLSSLQQIRDEFEADYSAEDMVELQERLSYLESVLTELTQE